MKDAVIFVMVNPTLYFLIQPELAGRSDGVGKRLDVTGEEKWHIRQSVSLNNTIFTEYSSTNTTSELNTVTTYAPSGGSVWGIQGVN